MALLFRNINNCGLFSLSCTHVVNLRVQPFVAFFRLIVEHRKDVFSFVCCLIVFYCCLFVCCLLLCPLMAAMGEKLVTAFCGGDFLFFGGACIASTMRELRTQDMIALGSGMFWTLHGQSCRLQSFLGLGNEKCPHTSNAPTLWRMGEAKMARY